MFASSKNRMFKLAIPFDHKKIIYTNEKTIISSCFGP